ncbi:hypothetical protein [Brevundimonas sp.]|uniref:hypothetical protein n=1 Tax=Brevundimonas sp. TaxID=1871086 RepID=UPI0035B1C6D5
MLMTIMAALAMQAAPAEDTSDLHGRCLWDNARDFEPSGEPVPGVVQAALSACRALEIEARPGTRLASLSPEGQQRVLGALEALVREDLELYVMRIRACRNTTGCDVDAAKAAR